MTDNDERIIALLQEVRDASLETAKASKANLELATAMMNTLRTATKWLVVFLGVPVLGTFGMWVYWAIAWVRHWFTN
jgi:hypothetical protein